MICAREKEKRSIVDSHEINVDSRMISCYKISMHCKHLSCWQCEDTQVVKLKQKNEKLKSIIEELLKITPDTRSDEPIVISAIKALED